MHLTKSNIAVFAAIAAALSDSRWNLRTVGAIAQHGVTPEQVESFVQQNSGDFIVETRSADGAKLIGFADFSDGEKRVLSELGKALADQRFTLRTVCNIASKARADEGDVADLVERLRLTIKHRRSDGAMLVGLHDWNGQRASSATAIDPDQ